MMSITLPENMAEFLGLSTCTLSLWSLGPYIANLLLFISLAIRYRGAIFFKYYEKRNTRPIRYCTITAIPYEALALFFLLAGPRILAVKDVLNSAFEAGAWEHRDFNNTWAWIFVGYFFMLDIVERVIFRRRILVPYYQMKARNSVNVTVLEQDVVDEKRPLLSAADEEAATAPPAADATSVEAPARWNMRARLTNVFKLQFPTPTGANVLSQMHISAFYKAMIVFMFMSCVSLTACMAEGDELENFFNLNVDGTLAPQFILISAWTSIRFVGLVIRSIAFGRRELGSAREGCVRLA